MLVNREHYQGEKGAGILLLSLVRENLQMGLEGFSLLVQGRWERKNPMWANDGKKIDATPQENIRPLFPRAGDAGRTA